jgi:uncharacterized protein YqjF (DUF2071 family)
MTEQFKKTSHRPWPLPSGKWRMAQRWNDLLFAHWPMQAAAIQSLLPAGLEVDTYSGTAWLGIVPFWMDRVRLRWLPRIPGANKFAELNLRTYVRDVRTGTPGVYFFSLEASSLLAVTVARGAFQLPYHWAEMRMVPRGEREFEFYSSRLLSRKAVRFSARYRGLGPSHKLVQSRPGTIEYFLTERYCLFTRDPLGRLVRANIHHVPWPLEDAEAEFNENDLAGAMGLRLPDTEPLLHYCRHMVVYVWSAELAEVEVLQREHVVATAQYRREGGRTLQFPEPGLPIIGKMRVLAGAGGTLRGQDE